MLLSVVLIQLLVLSDPSSISTAVLQLGSRLLLGCQSHMQVLQFLGTLVEQESQPLYTPTHTRQGKTQGILLDGVGASKSFWSTNIEIRFEGQERCQ